MMITSFINRTRTMTKYIVVLLTISLSSCLNSDESKDKKETVEIYVSPETAMFLPVEQNATYKPIETGDSIEGMKIKEGKNGQWKTVHFLTISGFEYQKGYGYELSVEKTYLYNPPADTPNISYKLISIISQTSKNQ